MKTVQTSACENFSHEENFEDVQEVTLRKEYGGSVFGWCGACRRRDADMIATECGLCGILVDETDSEQITGEGTIYCTSCLNKINQCTEEYERTYQTA